MREIVFDTETTGLSPLAGDRMVEIGCVELFNRVETGRTFHAYFNPEPADAERGRGGARPLRRLPLRQAAASTSAVEELLEFLGDARWSRTMPASTSASSTTSSAFAAGRWSA